MSKKNLFEDAKYQLQTIKNYNGVDGVKFNEKTFKKIEKALKLGALYEMFIDELDINVIAVSPKDRTIFVDVDVNTKEGNKIVQDIWKEIEDLKNE